MSPRKSAALVAASNIEALLDYAQSNLFLDSDDVIYVRNALLNLLGLPEPSDDIPNSYEFQKTLDELVDYAVKKGIAKIEESLLFETKIMGLLSPAPSKVIEIFDNIAAHDSVEAASNFLYDFSVASNYIRKVDIDKNLKWEFVGEKGTIGITINLAKPEKDPKDVERARLLQTGYPRCMLCAENVGYYGHLGHPARQTLRTIPLVLDDEQWFMQYSPFVYFEKHLIVASREHSPMNLTQSTFKKMMEFVELFPHFFVGSNAPLPIVGGSILAHDHYQGGAKVLPMFSSRGYAFYNVAGLPDVNISAVDWYNSVVRISSKNKQQLLSAIERLRIVWNDFTDEDVNVVAYTLDSNGKKIQHNTLTPICRFNDGEFVFDLILRNNRTDSAHPYGIFHPTEDMHNIKKEAIGLIEAMGLFILPGRLSKECADIKDILTGKAPLDFKALAADTNPLQKHLTVIAQLTADHGTKLRAEDAEEIINEYVNKTCEKILTTTAVFKNDETGRAVMDRFIKQVCGIEN